MIDFEAELKNRTDSQKSTPRGRGRPPGSKNGASSAGRPRKSTLNLRESIETVLTVGNALVANAYQNLRPYALQSDEIVALRDALVVEVESNPRLNTLVNKVGAVSPHFALATVVANITLTRYAMYQQIKSSGISPVVPTQDIDYADRNKTPDTAPVPVGAGTTHSDNWGYGERENPARIRDIAP